MRVNNNVRKRRPRRMKKRVYKKKLPITRSLTLKPAVHLFKRKMTQVMQLSNVSAPSGWTAEGNAYYKNWQFTLNNLPNPTDFTNLFAQYKLVGVQTEMIFANTVANDDNSQVLIYWDLNRDGQARPGTESQFLQSQTARHMTLKPGVSKPVKMYCKLKQLSNTFKLTDDDYALQTPKWLSTAEPNTPHFGTSMRIQRVDDRPFGTELANFQYCKVIHTVYLACRKVA